MAVVGRRGRVWAVGACVARGLVLSAALFLVDSRELGVRAFLAVDGCCGGVSR